ncbi:MAG: methyl-accepting chemotaxis protein [Spirochaetota bacterium]|nr:methyl-accepting chemotaxis protein [Spirochaetota bacterium]
MNLYHKINHRIEETYKHKDEAFQIVARLLFATLLGLSCISFIVVFIVEKQGLEVPILIVLMVVLIILSFLVLKGRAVFASLALSYLLPILLSTLIFTFPNTSGQMELYVIGFMNLFSMTLTSFIGFYAWQTFPIIAINLVAVILNIVLRIIPYSLKNNIELQIDEAVIVSILTLFAAICFFMVQKRSTRIIQNIKKLNTIADNRLQVLQAAMQASTEVLSTGDQLSQSAAKSTSLTENVTQSAVTVAFSMNKVLKDSERLSEELNGIAENSNTVKQSTESQSSVINQTSAAIEEMTASIHNIAHITRERKTAVVSLAKSTEEGQNIVNSFSEEMKKVEASTGSILDIVRVISSVASQTNLLAMNAAIEAAHAGEYGRGFAVVADEIRKLSEQTNKNVREITDTVKLTIKDIQNAAAGNSKAVASFTGIDRESRLVEEAMEEIINGLEELSKGTDEINRGVADSVTSTNTLRTAVASLDTQIYGAKAKLDSLKMATTNASQELDDIQAELSQIDTEVKKVEEIGIKNSQGISSITKALEEINQ